MHPRTFLVPLAIALAAGAAQAQGHMVFISGNVQTGQIWHAATSAGNGTSGSCSVRGHMPAGGGDIVYQCWYRDPNPSFCTPATFNLTKGVRVHWLP